MLLGEKHKKLFTMGFEAKTTGDLASENMRKIGIEAQPPTPHAGSLFYIIVQTIDEAKSRIVLPDEVGKKRK